MKKIAQTLALMICVSFIVSMDATTALTPTQIIKKANDLRYGETSIGTMKMSVVRPKYTRSIEMKMWTKGEDYSMVLITAPAAEKGQVFMKRKKEMWNYIPKISRMVKMPPSMLAQGWMGSDYTNDDLMNEGALVKKYNHKLVGSDKINGYDCYKIEAKPKANSDEIWGKIVLWISKKGFFTMKTMSYDEDNFLIKTETSSNIKTMHKKQMPTRFEIIPEDDPGHKTVVEIIDINFNEKLSESFFSKQNMKRIR